jgi:hypothetical protein
VVCFFLKASERRCGKLAFFVIPDIGRGERQGPHYPPADSSPTGVEENPPDKEDKS